MTSTFLGNKRQTGRDDRTFKIEGICPRETAKAILFVTMDGEEYWIPKSQIRPESEIKGKDDEGELIVSGWLAKQKDWV